MHSRLFELNTEKRDRDEWATEDTILFQHEWFTQSIADYIDIIDGEYCRAEDVHWLWVYLTGGDAGDGSKDKKFLNQYKDGKLTLTRVDLEAFFDRKYDHFCTLLDKFRTELTRENFCSFDTGTNWYMVTSMMEDKYSFYIKDDYEIQTLDSWLSWQYNQMQKNNLDSITYYVESIFDYHY